MVIELDGQRWAIEVKLTSTPGPEDMHRLNKGADMIAARKRILVSQVKESIASDRQVSCNPDWLLANLRGIV